MNSVTSKPDRQVWEISLPAELDSTTQELVVTIAYALGQKLLKAQQKYGYTDGWARPGWEDECREHLREHMEKGDPLDVIAYSAFLWYHKASTVNLIKKENSNGESN